MNAPPQGPGPAPAAESQPRTIVFVDDEEAILSSLRSLFRRSGHHLHAFGNAREALQFVSSVHVDLVISDLRMPEMTGVEFLNRVAAVNPGAVRLILSGYEDKTIVMNALAKGLAQHFILKPWNDPELKALVEQSLARLSDLRRQRLEKILGSIDSIPSSPNFQSKLHELLSRTNVSLDILAKEIETNPPIVAKLLRVANSVYYSSRKSVTTVREAVTFIGTEYVAGLVAAMEAFHGFNNTSSAMAEEQIDALWTQAVKRSTIVKLIVKQWPGFGPANQVHIASLLQDIGFAVRMCSEEEKYAQFIELCNGGAMTRYEADASVFGITHDDVGAALLEYWNLPSDIVSGVAQHHRRCEGNAFVQVLQIAGILEGSDPLAPHDPAITPLVSEWREKIASELPAELTTEKP